MPHPARKLGPLLVLPPIVCLVAAASFFPVPTETTISELAPGVFFRKSQTQPRFLGCNQGWVEFKDFVLVIDANFPNQAEEVIGLICEKTDKPIRYVFDTHYHGDHADGNMMYARVGATPLASERSKAEFETKGIEGFERAKSSKVDEYGSLTYVTPTLYFQGRMILDDGTQRVEFLHLGHGHTQGDAVAWLPKQGILFTGDACVNGAFNYTGDSNLDSWIDVLSKLEELPVQVVAPGHGELSDKSLLGTQKRYFTELLAAIREKIASGRSLEQIKEELDLPFYKEWTGVDVRTRAENIEFAYRQLMK
jgi:glyoxylase-like metal-dependent hydrolase (beta-lactamase superfamily II)